MSGTVIIDCFPSCVSRYRHGYAVVAVDVIRATTTAVTAVWAGRRCFPVSSLDQAYQLKERFAEGLLIGEVAGDMPDGFDMNNSPAQLLLRNDQHCPVIMLSSSGTQLMHESQTCETAYVACLRNYRFLANHLAGLFPKVAIIGAGSRGEFREEDQMCCAWIAEELLKAGYTAENSGTMELVESWSGLRVEACLTGNSAAYLKNSNQLDDLDFILAHINDVPSAFTLEDGEVVPSHISPKIGAGSSLDPVAA